jgi:hypothetical protein
MDNSFSTTSMGKDIWDSEGEVAGMEYEVERLWRGGASTD